MQQEVPVKVRRVTRAHIVQSLLAGGFIFLALLVMHSVHSYLAVTSIGASTFLVFTFPQAQTSHPRLLIGGYCIGVVCGLTSHVVIGWLGNVELLTIPAHVICCACGVVCAMLIMTIFNFEHPSSAALTIAVALADNPVVLGLAALGCILVLCALKQLLLRWLVNL